MTFYYCGADETESRPGCDCDHCNHINAGYVEVRRKCPVCKGRGLDGTKQCGNCSGIGQKSEWVKPEEMMGQIDFPREAESQLPTTYRSGGL